MTYALNEVQALAKKAARGAGYSWGMAEEAAFAVQWLCARDQDGCGALAGCLTMADGMAFTDVAPAMEGANWSGSAGWLCPLATGAALADRASGLRHGISAGKTIRPLLLLPFAGLIASDLQCVIVVDWVQGQAATNGTLLSLTEPPPKIAQSVRVGPGGMTGQVTARTTRASPSNEAWACLESFAHRTYAPATEASRLSGAGAGLTDND